MYLLLLWTALNKLDSRAEVSFLIVFIKMVTLKTRPKLVCLLRERQVELGILEHAVCVSARVWPVSMLVTLAHYVLRKYWGQLGHLAEGVW